MVAGPEICVSFANSASFFEGYVVYAMQPVNVIEPWHQNSCAPSLAWTLQKNFQPDCRVLGWGWLATGCGEKPRCALASALQITSAPYEHACRVVCSSPTHLPFPSAHVQMSWSGVDIRGTMATPVPEPLDNQEGDKVAQSLSNEFGCYMLPSSPNWYCSSVASWSSAGIYAFGCKNSISLLRVATNRFIGDLMGHTNRVTAVEFINSPELIDGGLQLCASGSDDLSVRVWDLGSRQVIASHRTHKAGLTALATSNTDPTMVISGDKKGNVVRWKFPLQSASDLACEESEVPSASVLCTTFDAPITCINTCPTDSTRAVIGLQSGRMTLIETEKMTVTHRLGGHEAEVQCLKWNFLPQPESGEGWIVSTSKDKTIRIWDPSNGSEHCSYRVKKSGWKGSHEGDATRVWISATWIGRDKFVSSGLTGALCVWQVPRERRTSDITKFAPFSKENGHSRTVFSLNTLPNSFAQLISTSLDRALCVWNIKKGKLLWRAVSLGGFVYSCDSPRWQPNIVGLGIGDKTIRLWNTDRAGDPYSSTTIWKGLQGKVTVIRFHPTEEGLMAYGTEHGRVGLWDTLKQTHKRDFTSHQRMVYELDFKSRPTVGSDGVDSSAPYLYSLGGGDVIYQVSVAEPKADSVVLLKSRSKEREMSGFAWKPDGSLLGVGYSDGSLDVFHVSDDPKLTVRKTKYLGS